MGLRNWLRGRKTIQVTTEWPGKLDWESCLAEKRLTEQTIVPLVNALVQMNNGLMALVAAGSANPAAQRIAPGLASPPREVQFQRPSAPPSEPAAPAGRVKSTELG